MSVNIIVMRHSSRCDDKKSFNPNIISLNKSNPRIDPTQYYLIYDAINMLNTNMLDGQLLDCIYSSPYSRCLETAYAIETKNKIIINGRLSEVNHFNVLKQQINEVHEVLKNDLRFLFGKTHDEISQINFVLNEESRGIGGSADDRYRDELNKITEFAIFNNYKNILIVSHGDCLASLVSMCGKSVYSTDFCSYVISNFDIEKGWTLLQDKCYKIGIED